MFLVCEFDDGLHLVPDCWVMPDKSSCFWPQDVVDQFRLNKMVARQQEPDSDWDILNIKKIYGESGKYLVTFFPFKTNVKF